MTFMDRLKQAIIDKLLMIIQNPHTSGSAFAIGMLKLAGIIWPKHKATFDEIMAAAVIWLGINAGDASRSASKQDLSALGQAAAVAIQKGDTSLLTKSATTQAPPADQSPTKTQ